jgi:hypothetical protein
LWRVLHLRMGGAANECTPSCPVDKRRKDCEDRQRSLKVLGCGW